MFRPTDAAVTWQQEAVQEDSLSVLSAEDYMYLSLNEALTYSNAVVVVVSATIHLGLL